MNSYEILQTAAHNKIMLLCLQSHTVHYLQPFDRAFFKPLRTYFRVACDEWIWANPDMKIERCHFSALLFSTWSHVATSELSGSISCLWATGIFPLNQSAIPDHAFLTSVTPTSQDSNEFRDFSASDFKIPSHSKTTSDGSALHFINSGQKWIIECKLHCKKRHSIRYHPWVMDIKSEAHCTL